MVFTWAAIIAESLAQTWRLNIAALAQVVIGQFHATQQTRMVNKPKGPNGYRRLEGRVEQNKGADEQNNKELRA